jgi:aspartyl-tRNA(Asn)/glutamyl-tRNA(Gln) amidotransferase subunit C
MSLTPDDVRRLARLARIAIRPDESAGVLERLNRVLGLIEEMRSLDTKGVPPMAHALDLVARARADEVTERDQRAAYQSVAPAVEEGLYLVPRVVE